jgi:hypothetical protein
MKLTDQRWVVASTGDCLRVSAEFPLNRIREQIQRDASRWARQGLTFDGVSCDRDESAADVYVVDGKGYQLRTTRRDGFWPVDALQCAASDDWNSNSHFAVDERRERVS